LLKHIFVIADKPTVYTIKPKNGNTISARILSGSFWDVAATGTITLSGPVEIPDFPEIADIQFHLRL